MNWNDFKDLVKLDPAVKWTGFTPYHARSAWQKAFSDKVLKSLPKFSDINPGIKGANPDICLMWDLAVQVVGSIGFMTFQKTGSCVGAGAATADYHCQLGDIVADKKNYEPKFTDPFPTWGMGRKMGGGNGPGDGSYGAVQIQAENEFGLLEAGQNGLLQPTLEDGGWLSWNEKYEYDYSWPRIWPISESTLSPIANQHKITSFAKVTTLQELEDGFAQGYSATEASDFGCQNPRVNSDGLLFGGRDTTWNHQMVLGGYAKIKGTRYWLIINNWGNYNAACPMLTERFSSKGYKTGVFWVNDNTMMNNLIKQDEVFLRSNINGFPGRKIDWSGFAQKIHLS